MLDLSWNHIININPLENNRFKNLEELNLKNNDINSSLNSTTITSLKSNISNLIFD